MRKEILYRPIGILRLFWKVKRQKLGDGKRIYLLNIPSHGNLGDHLISVAEIKFFADNFPQYELVRVSSADLYFSIRIALSSVRQQDILCMTGGGYLGSMYQEEERLMRILGLFPHNKIVVFPQSIYYEPSEQGELKKQSAAVNYHKHNKLFIIAREQNTFNLLKNYLMKGKDNRIALVPDMALFLDYESKEKRNTILWCLRSDDEKNSNSSGQLACLKSLLETNGYIQKSTDTYVNHSVSIENECGEVYSILKEFATAKIVVTDRLHGMIYAAISGTSVIALDNSTGKVRSFYEQWLSSVPYIKFVNDEQTAEKAVKELLKMKEMSFDKSFFVNKFKPIIDAINA